MISTRTTTAARDVAQRDALNFLLTNRIPRRFATTLAGRVARIESKWLTRAGIVVWQALGGSLDLHEAEPRDYPSLEAVFTRRLKPGMRRIDLSAGVLTSPCDAIVGAHGTIEKGMAIQAKGFPYPIGDLLLDADLVERHAGGSFVTLRLRSTMYHRFHAPCDGHVRSVLWIGGDTWNVNPPALRRVEHLYCRNERVVLEIEPADEDCALTLVAVAAILVSSVHLECLAEPPRVQSGRLARYACDARVSRGDELGHFRNGSTIIVFATPGFEPAPAVVEGATIRVGEPLLRHTRASHPALHASSSAPAALSLLPSSP